MKARFPILLTSALTLALAAPGPTLAKQDKARGERAKGKDKEKKDAKGNRAALHDPRRNDDDDDDRDRDRDRDRDGNRDRDRDRDGKITICHIPAGNPSARHTITVGESAWKAHQRHGDFRGACAGRNRDGRDGAFDRLDRNDDGRLGRGEWPYGRDAFERLDVNDDDLITRDEYRRRS